MSHENTTEHHDLSALLWTLREADTLLGAVLPSGTTVTEEIEARRLAINKWAEKNGHNTRPGESEENVASADAVEPQALEVPDSDYANPYSYNSAPLSPTNDRWTGNPETDRAILVGRMLSVDLFPKS